MTYYVIFNSFESGFFAGYDTGQYGSGYPYYSNRSALIYIDRQEAETLCVSLSKYNQGLSVKEFKLN